MWPHANWFMKVYLRYIVILSSKTLGGNPCSESNGGCAHLCLATSNTTHVYVSSANVFLASTKF